ncbi:MAG: flagellar basal body P-ring formation chaperone FlgA [Proteobacteria bacterium]|nr:flagellar basal body P-ring formation chaperone FlgA [Pseudomonadota bacterium]
MKSEKLNVKSGKQESMRTRFVLYILLFTIHYSLFTAFAVFAADQSTVEVKLTNFIKQFYSEKGDVYIKFNNYPEVLKDKAKVSHINFAKVPDSNGDGLCTVEIEDKRGLRRNVYVSFKALNKKRLYALKQNLKKGDIVTARDIAKKEVFLNENKGNYPSEIEDVIGKVIKKDVNAGAVFTNDMIEDNYVIKKNEIINVVAQSKRLSVQTKGRAEEKGRIGDTIRVKNMTSQKEILGKVTGSGVVNVDM